MTRRIRIVGIIWHRCGGQRDCFNPWRPEFVARVEAEYADSQPRRSRRVRLCSEPNRMQPF
jgi:hypothetical protein